MSAATSGRARLHEEVFGQVERARPSAERQPSGADREGAERKGLSSGGDQRIPLEVCAVADGTK